MKITRETIAEKDLIAALEPRLLERVFHVTSHEVANKILNNECLLPNTDYTLASGFGFSQNSFFRIRGCISLFDFRNPTKEGLERAYYDASGLNPKKSAKNNPAFLFLNALHFYSLIPWNKGKDHGQMIVPYVECGHKGEITPSMIDEIIFVMVIPRPKSDLELALENASLYQE